MTQKKNLPPREERSFPKEEVVFDLHTNDAQALIKHKKLGPIGKSMWEINQTTLDYGMQKASVLVMQVLKAEQDKIHGILDELEEKFKDQIALYEQTQKKVLEMDIRSKRVFQSSPKPIEDVIYHPAAKIYLYMVIRADKIVRMIDELFFYGQLDDIQRKNQIRYIFNRIADYYNQTMHSSAEIKKAGIRESQIRSKKKQEKEAKKQAAKAAIKSAEDRESEHILEPVPLKNAV